MQDAFGVKVYAFNRKGLVCKFVGVANDTLHVTRMPVGPFYRRTQIVQLQVNRDEMDVGLEQSFPVLSTWPRRLKKNRRRRQQQIPKAVYPTRPASKGDDVPKLLQLG
mmetsp:Transcript_1041/g.3515  ORF Transcript_1041/g.3515 Transcript_1041/m.3515 type:complete len:108 (-) Transcript_1041:28-351(-)